MAYDNNMSGALFKNGKKEKGSKQPDYRGECEIGGKKYEIAGWMKQSKGGNPYMSLKFQEPQQSRSAKRNEDADDEIIPF